jgi:cold shock CspA family protein
VTNADIARFCRETRRRFAFVAPHCWAPFIFRRVSLRGQITFFDFKRHFGIIVAETGERHFLSGHDLANPVDRNDWVAFDSKPSLVSGAECNLVAKNVCRIECPEEYLLRGTITKFFRDLGYGFIKYKYGGHNQSIFFHCQDLMRIDGMAPIPCVGAEVSFCLGQKTDRPVACQIWIERRPDFEEYFESAPELPIDVPEPGPPVAVSESSLLSPGNKNVPMIELIRRRREGIQLRLFGRNR